MLQKIRAALQHRDTGYQVGDGVIELDAGTFGHRATGTHCDVLVAIETKAWENANGQARSRAGFAKVLVGKETKAHAQQLVDTGVRAGAMVKTDGSRSFRNVTGVDVDDQVVSGDRAACE